MDLQTVPVNNESGIWFSTDAEAVQQSKSIESADKDLYSTGIFAFSLSVISFIVHTFMVKGTKGHLGSPMASNSDFTGEGARAKYLGDTARTGTSWSTVVLYSALVFDQDSA